MAQSTPASITTAVTGALQRIATRSHAIAALTGIALVIFAGIIAPGESPDWWAWTRLLVAAASAGIALAIIDVARSPGAVTHARSRYLLISAIFLLVTIILSATFTPLTVLFALLVIGLVVLHLYARGPSSLLVFWALLGILIPFWVWSAFDAWDRLLLLLIPLGVIGLISLEHALRADLYGDSISERYAAWLGIIGMTAVLLIASLIASIDGLWVAIGAGLTILLAGTDMAPQRRRFSEAVPSITLPAAALLALMLTWLVAL